MAAIESKMSKDEKWQHSSSRLEDRGFRYRGRVPPAGCPLGVEFRALSTMTQQLIQAANSVRLTLRLYESTRTIEGGFLQPVGPGTQTVDIQSESKNQTNQKPKNGSTVPQDNN